jgi:glycosyltransferase involved in cell wall biosynthesis
MRILIHHLAQVPVATYGGSERVLVWLARSLADRGHQVGVVVAPGSSSFDDRIKLYLGDDGFFESKDEYDIVHFFTNPTDRWYSAGPENQMVTIHGNGKVGERFHRNAVFLSRDHAERHGGQVFVHNGIDLDEIPMSHAPRTGPFLFLANTNWKVKNVRGAFRYCRKAKKDLWIAGGTGPMDLRLRVFLRSLLAPKNQWWGRVNDIQKIELLQSAQALVFPILWNEPFGLVMVESLAAGTPVLANPYGSVKEILSFAPKCILKNEQDWLSALRGEFSFPEPEECRAYVASQFTRQIMAENYEKLYARLMNGEALNQQQPVTLIGAEVI